MIIDLNELNIKSSINIDYDVKKDEYLDKRINELDARVVGNIKINSNNDYELNCEFTGNMYINDSISLESIPYHFTININETLEELKENYPDCYNFSQNTLDLKTILWQNIVLEVPISFTICDDANIKGNGWELINEEKEEEIDPRLKKLEDLLKGDD